MKTVGVDLGMTNSCVYYLDAENNPVLVADRLGRKIFPSVVWCAGPGKETVVGAAAKTRLGQQPSPVVEIHRKLGTSETVELGGAQVSPTVVLTHILTFLKSLVEEATGDQVGAAVVTVPAYFDAASKKDTYSAAVDAFFGGDIAKAEAHLELLVEPEAAALAYILEDPAEHIRILAYDLRGGTFDVTVLERSRAAGISVLKFGGDPHFGGDNIDERLAAWILYLLRGGKPEALDRILDPARYPAEARYTILRQLLANDTFSLRSVLRSDDRELLAEARPRYVLAFDGANSESGPRIQKVKALAEQAKLVLTAEAEVSITHQGIFLDDEGEIVDIDLTLHRAAFNRLIGDLVERTMEETWRVLAASGVTSEQIDRVILVGGSTRMPIIREELGKRFSCPVLLNDPELIVARGASLKARQLQRSPDAIERLAPRLTKNISIQSERGFRTLLREGDSLPAHATMECFRGTSDECIIIPLFEAERWLTNLVVTGVDPSLPEGAAIDLRVTVNADFTCGATATVRTTRQRPSWILKSPESRSRPWTSWTASWMMPWRSSTTTSRKCATATAVPASRAVRAASRQTTGRPGASPPATTTTSTA
jgi:molecular chaperone DnaK (HSP70)